MRNVGMHRSTGASIWCLDVCYLTQNNEPDTYRLCRKWLTSQIKTQVLFSYLQQRSLACKAGSIPRHNWFQLEELHASTMTSSCPRTQINASIKHELGLFCCAIKSVWFHLFVLIAIVICLFASNGVWAMQMNIRNRNWNRCAYWHWWMVAI